MVITGTAVGRGEEGRRGGGGGRRGRRGYGRDRGEERHETVWRRKILLIV